MPNKKSVRNHNLVGLLILISLPSVAQAPPPSKEFWEYLAEYGDDSGRILDPIDYDESLQLKQGSESEIAKQPSPEAQDKPKVRHADMKIEQQSSLQSSAVGLSGESL